MSAPSSLAGKRPTIWGGSSGIGFSVAKQLVNCAISSLTIVGTTQAKLDDAMAKLVAMKNDKNISINAAKCVG